MMDDLVTRLRTSYGPGDWSPIKNAAADEIERLRNALNEVITNGEWLSDASLSRDWLISPEVYALVEGVLAGSVCDTDQEAPK